MTRREGFGIEVATRAIGHRFEGCILERANNGVSTEVYRVEQEGRVWYLRVAKEGESMANEAKAHELCQAAGALVPEVVYFEEDNMVLGRSLMVTRDMGGACIENIEDGVQKGLMVEVGRNLAKINSISVPGIGYIDKEVGNGFVGSGKNYDDFVLKDVDEKIAQLASLGILEKEIAESAAEFVRQNTKMMLEYRDGWLAHGDFDMTHVFAENGKLTGFIDFGDIRAASRYHDLAHFYMYSPEYFDDLIKGYGEITTLDENYEERVRAEAVLIAVSKLHWIGKKDVEKAKSKRKVINTIRETIRQGDII